MFASNRALQVEMLLEQYPTLCVQTKTDEQIELAGTIEVHLSYNDFPVFGTYGVSIIIPLNDMELPYVLDAGKHVDVRYPHLYVGGRLCLATEADIRWHFSDGFDLTHWMIDYVEPYYYSYEYYQRFGEFPFGERNHGVMGVLQTYKDILGAADEYEALKIMTYMRNNAYRGHHLCPCESGRRTRDCHGSKMFLILSNDFCHKAFESDMKDMENEAKRARKHDEKHVGIPKQ